MKAPAPAPTNPTVARWSTEPAWKGLKVGSASAATLLPRQVQIAFEGTGPMSSRAIVPQTAAAAELLTGPGGRTAERALRGMLATLDGTGAANNLKGITLADSPDGWLLNATMHELAAVEQVTGRRLDPASPDVRAAIDKRLADRRAAAEAGTWCNTLGWVNVGSRHSAALRALLRGETPPGAKDQAAARRAGTELALGLSHELAHSVTPDAPGATRERGDDWIEEGAADVISVMKAPTTARGMGLPYGDAEAAAYLRDGYGYGRFRTGVERLLRLAGADPATPDGAARAERLLQEKSDDQVPSHLAEAIVQHNQVSPEQYRTVRGALVQSRGSEAALNDLEQLVRGAGFDPSAFSGAVLIG